MQMKDAMLFQAKIYQRQNRQLLEELAKLPAEMLTKEYPALAQGTIIKNLDDMINNAIFTIHNIALSCIDKDAHDAKYVARLEEGEMGIRPIPKSYATESLAVISEVILDLSQKYIDIYTNCDEEELEGKGGLPPFDYGSKGLCIAFQLRAEIYAVLREQGLFHGEHPFEGPLA